jgi:hypothetical protein
MGLEKGKDSYINLSTCQYHLMPEYGRILRNAVIFLVVYMASQLKEQKRYCSGDSVRFTLLTPKFLGILVICNKSVPITVTSYVKLNVNSALTLLLAFAPSLVKPLVLNLPILLPLIWGTL